MSIYTSTKVAPYVYICIDKDTSEFYIGYREANKEPSHIDLPKYKTSATKIHNNFDKFNWYIIAEFFDGDSAYDFEQLLIYENWNNEALLNRQCFYGKSRFKSHIGWSKGLTVETDDRLRQMAQKISVSRQGIPAWNKGLPSPTSAENGKKSAMKQAKTVTGRRMKKNEDGSRSWYYPEN